MVALVAGMLAANFTHGGLASRSMFPRTFTISASGQSAAMTTGRGNGNENAPLVDATSERVTSHRGGDEQGSGGGRSRMRAQYGAFTATQSGTDPPESVI